MTFAFKLFLTTEFVLLLAMGVELLMCALSLIELGKDRDIYWNGEDLIIRDFEITAEEYLDQLDYWYPSGRFVNSLTEKDVENKTCLRHFKKTGNQDTTLTEGW